MNHPGTEMPGFTGAHGGRGESSRRYADRPARLLSKLEVRQLLRETGFVPGFQAAQVEMIRIVADMADDRHRQAAESGFEGEQGLARLFGRWSAKQGKGGRAFDRQGATANLAAARRQTDHNSCAKGCLDERQQALAGGFDVGQRPGEQAQGGQALAQAIRVAIQAQRCFQRGEGGLANAQGTLERVFLDFGDY